MAAVYLGVQGLRRVRANPEVRGGAQHYTGSFTDAAARMHVHKNTVHYRVRKARLPRGKYRKISGNEATVFGLLTIWFIARADWN